MTAIAPASPGPFSERLPSSPPSPPVETHDASDDPHDTPVKRRAYTTAERCGSIFGSPDGPPAAPAVRTYGRLSAAEAPVAASQALVFDGTQPAAVAGPAGGACAYDGDGDGDEDAFAFIGTQTQEEEPGDGDDFAFVGTQTQEEGPEDAEAVPPRAGVEEGTAAPSVAAVAAVDPPLAPALTQEKLLEEIDDFFFLAVGVRPRHGAASDVHKHLASIFGVERQVIRKEYKKVIRERLTTLIMASAAGTPEEDQEEQHEGPGGDDVEGGDEFVGDDDASDGDEEDYMSEDEDYAHETPPSAQKSNNKEKKPRQKKATRRPSAAKTSRRATPVALRRKREQMALLKRQKKRVVAEEMEDGDASDAPEDEELRISIAGLFELGEDRAARAESDRDRLVEGLQGRCQRDWEEIWSQEERVMKEALAEERGRLRRSQEKQDMKKALAEERERERRSQEEQNTKEARAEERGRDAGGAPDADAAGDAVLPAAAGDAGDGPAPSGDDTEWESGSESEEDELEILGGPPSLFGTTARVPTPPIPVSPPPRPPRSPMHSPASVPVRTTPNLNSRAALAHHLRGRAAVAANGWLARELGYDDVED
eukprot:CAMPEP_0194272980 /NCGR_PEP_ID=MMETSP0169-20130528/6419_1 /TAXON_ID=218684 /ORGANISM="Corethron pennatum, Strain L29A3" /LENGTH=595 /DNA_ID=CAMNT_0039015791 /DNA_START=60 /DNA_END=1845 /DNA_ORIENTATION=+